MPKKPTVKEIHAAMRVLDHFDMREAAAGLWFRQVHMDIVDEGLTGPENSREEVVGTSTKGKSANLSNSGFSGGSPVAY